MNVNVIKLERDDTVVLAFSDAANLSASQVRELKINMAVLMLFLWSGV